jgi:hypothetical protein
MGEKKMKAQNMDHMHHAWSRKKAGRDTIHIFSLFLARETRY